MREKVGNGEPAAHGWGCNTPPLTTVHPLRFRRVAFLWKRKAFADKKSNAGSGSGEEDSYFPHVVAGRQDSPRLCTVEAGTVPTGRTNGVAVKARREACLPRR